MWRIHAPDGRVSDMVNLKRAKDAAVAWARPRGLGGSEKAHWDRRESAAAASIRGLNGTEGAPQPPEAAPAAFGQTDIGPSSVGHVPGDGVGAMREIG